MNHPKPTTLARMPTRSKAGLEALCISLARRLPGLQRVRYVEVVAVGETAGGSNWRIGRIHASPPLGDGELDRIEHAIRPWQRRFRLE